MCRHLGYLGPPVTLESLLYAPEHSLLDQAKAPREQRASSLNADGFGVGWYDVDSRREPARYRTSRPMWSDRSFANVAGIVSATAVLAAVRSASPGFPIEETGNAPFTDGPWLFSLNGVVDAFHDGVGVALKRRLSDRRLARIEGSADSEVLFALALDLLDAGAPAPDALASVVTAVKELSGGRLNLLLHDGTAMAATAWANSLYTVDRHGATIVASEPFDAGTDWRAVPDAAVVSVTPAGTEVDGL